MPLKGSVAWNKGRGADGRRTPPNGKGAAKSIVDALSKRRHDRSMAQAQRASEADAQDFRRGKPGDAGRAEAEKRFNARVKEMDFSPGSRMAEFAAGSSAATALKAPAPSTLSPVDAAIAQAQIAMDAGDFDKAGKLFDKASRLEAAEKAKEAKVNAQAAQIVDLIDNQGWDAVEAESHVTGMAPEAIRRRDFIAKARSEGHVGKGFDELVAAMHAQFAAEQYFRAEQETHGVLKAAYLGKYRASDLWLVNDNTARKIMTEEMAAWFDANGGRVNRDVFKRAILDGTDVFDTTQRQDYLR